MNVAAESLSRARIRKITEKLRELIGCSEKAYFPIVEFIEWIMGDPENDFDYEIVEAQEMQDMYGNMNTGLNVMKIREDVYIGAINGKITNGGKGYVRFPDGTQICYGTLSSTGYTSVNHNIFFAKPFIDTEYVVILTKGVNGKFITEFGEYDSSGNRNRSVDKCSVHYDATTANYTKTISWVAIGRCEN